MKLGYAGWSSHSGSRTFITNFTRKVYLAGVFMRDVMNLAGYSDLQTTQRYVEQNPEVQNNMIKLLYTLLQKPKTELSRSDFWSRVSIVKTKSFEEIRTQYPD